MPGQRPKKAMFEISVPIAAKRTKTVDEISDTRIFFRLDYNNTSKN